MPTATTSRIPPAPQTCSDPAERIGACIEGRGTPVVLLHSSMSTKSQWRQLAERMRDRYRMIAIDLYAYGETSVAKLPERLTLDDEVRVVESVLSTTLQAGESFHLVGHSYGGVIALQLALGQPQRVRSLNLFEPISLHLLPEGDPGRAELHSLWRTVETSLMTGDISSGAASFIDYWNGRGTFAQLSKVRQATICRLLPKTALEFQAVAREALRGDVYHRIVAPTCLLAGHWSPRSARSSVSVLAELLPHARQHRVAAGHMAPVTHPALINPIIERFIGSVDRLPTPSRLGEALPGESQRPSQVA